MPYASVPPTKYVNKLAKRMKIVEKFYYRSRCYIKFEIKWLFNIKIYKYYELDSYGYIQHYKRPTAEEFELLKQLAINENK